MVTKFSLGQMLATPGALEAIAESGQAPDDFIARHAAGDWGDLPEDDRQLNEISVRDGSRILSAYLTAKGVKIWVITEAIDDEGKRAATTILLPDEY
jgi:hypothetical protein